MAILLLCHIAGQISNNNIPVIRADSREWVMLEILAQVGSKINIHHTLAFMYYHIAYASTMRCKKKKRKKH